MSPFTFFEILLYFQACFMLNVLGQSGATLVYGPSIDHGCRGGYSLKIPNGSGKAYGWSVQACDAYGGVGMGTVDAGGELPVAGSTLVSGQVPVLGAVRLGGEVPASGTVTIFAKCGCDQKSLPML